MCSLHVRNVGPKVVEERQGLVERVVRIRCAGSQHGQPLMQLERVDHVQHPRACKVRLWWGGWSRGGSWGGFWFRGRIAPDASRGGSLRERSRKPDVRRYLCSSGGRCRSPGRGCVRSHGWSWCCRRGFVHKAAVVIGIGEPGEYLLGWYDGGCGAHR